jgi:hypothetical protein
VFLFRRDGRWQFGIAMTRRNFVQAMLIDADLSVDRAQRDVLRELAMSYGVRVVGSWGPSNRSGSWRANLWPITQPD